MNFPDRLFASRDRLYRMVRDFIRTDLGTVMYATKKFHVPITVPIVVTHMPMRRSRFHMRKGRR